MTLDTNFEWWLFEENPFISYAQGNHYPLLLPNLISDANVIYLLGFL